eukprot:scaffold246314_cov26-Tisochrysis_lutea.AAC.1
MGRGPGEGSELIQGRGKDGRSRERKEGGGMLIEPSPERKGGEDDSGRELLTSLYFCIYYSPSSGRSLPSRKFSREYS